jgi:CdiI immunity protein
MKTAYPNLDQLFGAYFNQDWKMDAPTVEAVLERYLNDGPVEDVAKALSELKSLLTLPEDKIEKTLDLMHCYYYPLGDGRTYREWLNQVADRLEEFLQNPTTPT